MKNAANFSLFLPIKVLENLSKAYLFGHCYTEQNNITVNCKFSVGIIQHIKDPKLFQQTADINKKESNESFQLQLLGIIYSSKRRQKFPSISEDILSTYFILRVDATNDNFYIEKLCFDSIKETVSTKIILYDSQYFLNSSFLLSRVNSNHRHNFLKFLETSLKNFQKPILPYNQNSDIIDFSLPSKQSKSVFVFNYFFHSLELFLRCCNIVASLWLVQNILKMRNWSLVGQQLHQRILHCKEISSNWKMQNSLCLKCNNLMFAILLDVIFGWIVTFSFLKFNMPTVLLENSIDYANDMVNELQKLIYWLMGVPAGLKLNIPLNSALGHFFLYHIYLWEAYITIVLPIFHLVLQISTVIGVFGLTFFISLISDLVSLATVHIYCFYGYAARLYGYEVSCLCALWRLFRGKKYNPLRQRVDSYSYDIHQLYLGTLLFTVLLFLLPTILVYYFVFTCLRILVLISQGILLRIIRLFSILPLYALISRLTSASETAGEIYFTVFSSHTSLVLSMQVNQSSFSTVIKHTLPDLCKQEGTLSWKMLLLNILCGKIIYPL